MRQLARYSQKDERVYGVDCANYRQWPQTSPHHAPYDITPRSQSAVSVFLAPARCRYKDQRFHDVHLSANVRYGRWRAWTHAY
jgi:hypothetical protein